MSLDSVRDYLAAHAPDIAVIVTEESSATVDQAARAHGVLPEQIAKTLCVRVGDEPVLLVLSGPARLDNRKFRAAFGTKPRMVGSEDVAEITGHPIGGVCPFGLPVPLRVFCDRSLDAFDMVIPAAGATNAALRINPQRMAALTGAEWVDVAENRAPVAAEAFTAP